jgi:hypothetical protein
MTIRRRTGLTLVGIACALFVVLIFLLPSYSTRIATGRRWSPIWKGRPGRRWRSGGWR